MFVAGSGLSLARLKAENIWLEDKLFRIVTGKRSDYVMKSLRPSTKIGLCTIASTLVFAVAATSLAVAKIANQDSYTAKLPGGQQVRVRFVGPGESSKLKVWAPDGSATSDGPDNIHMTYSSEGKLSKRRQVRICFELSGIDAAGIEPFAFGNTLVPAKLAGQLNQGGSRSGFSSTDSVSCYGFSVPDRLKTADLQVAIGSGNFRVVASNVDGEGELKANLTSKHKKQTSYRTYNGNTESIYSLNDYTEITFEVPAAIATKQWCLRAFDKDGKPVRTWVIFGGFENPDEPGSERQWHAQCQCDAKQIKRLELSARDYKWLKVKDIHLTPSETSSAK